MESKTADVFARMPLTPNQYTALSLVFALFCGYFIVIGDYWPALLFFALASVLDFVDGAVARRKNLASKPGAYWDTIADRYVEVILLFSFLFVWWPKFYFPSAVWIFLALAGSIMTTYAKAAAKEKGLTGIELKGGLMSRGERLLIYAAIIVFLVCGESSLAVLALAVLAILTNLTALQRIKNALRR